ncbi:MAG: hypothetical protein AB7I19_20500 [Planctomycetota bacterium]
MKPSLLVSGLLVGLSTPLLAQDPAALEHSHPFRDQLRRDAETGLVWCSGDNFKASFGSGFTFFPVLGENAPKNLPLDWQTQSIRIGAQELSLSAGESSFTADRYEIRRGGIVERYDVTVSGIEQSFIFESPSAWLRAGVPSDGNLAVRAKLNTPLHAAPTEARHGALVFADAKGNPTIRYGEAFAFDAAGRRIEVTTAFDGEHVTLEIARDWLDQADYPVTLDPLTSSSGIGASPATGSGNSVSRDDGNNRLLFAYARFVSATDSDLYLRLTDDSLAAPSTVFSDLSNLRSTRRASVDYVRGASRWICAFGVEEVTNEFIRVLAMNGADTTGATAVTVDVPRDLGLHDGDPAFGGTDAGGQIHGYLAFRRELSPGITPNTGNSRVYGTLLDATNLTFGPRQSLRTEGGTNYDAEWPFVSRQVGVNDGWVVVWQDYNYDNANDDWDVLAQRIAPDGTRVDQTTLGSDNVSTAHKVRPVVAGSNDRYLLAVVHRANSGKTSLGSGDEIRVQRFDWPATGQAPIEQTVRVLKSSPSPNLNLRDSSAPIAADHRTDSHWAVAWWQSGVGVSIARLGFQGRAVETQVAYTNSGTAVASWPAVTYDNDNQEFVMSFGVADGGTNPIYARRFYSDATQSSLGTGCVGTLYATNRGTAVPFAGSESFGLTMENGLPNSLTWIFLGFGYQVNPLPAGAPGCFLLLNPGMSLLPVHNELSNAVGTVTVSLPLPDTIATADVFWQAIQFSGGNLYSTNALFTQIR